jgi:hypothetical protein
MRAIHDGAYGTDVGGGMVPESNPLRSFFFDLVSHHFASSFELRDTDMSAYISDMLTEFCYTDQLHRIRNVNGRPLDDVGEMLLESDPVYGPAPSFDRERQVRKHIGDYTLFFTGMFPESINHLRLRRARLENMIDFIKAGKESYYIVSKFDCFEYQKVAPLFRKLSERFEECVVGLNMVKNELQERQHPIVHKAPELLM